MDKDIKSPGVYVTEVDAFPPSVVGVETAVPAFIGNTETATINGKPIYNKAIKISSMADFESIFGKGFAPLYNITEKTGPDDFDFSVVDSNKTRYFKVEPANSARFNLYHSMRLFYDNGGGSCYVVSVGDYTGGGTEPRGVEVQADKLKAGLDVIAEQVGPTMLAIPDAVLLPADSEDATKSEAFASIIKEMLTQSGKLKDRVAILDVFGTSSVEPEGPASVVQIEKVVRQFRSDVGIDSLSYGASYFPFLNTSVVQPSEIDYTAINLADDDQRKLLQQILTIQNKNMHGDSKEADQAQQYIDSIAADAKPEDVKALEQTLTNALPVLKEIETAIVKNLNVLPPSGAMAGIYSLNDNDRGVWTAPANRSLASVDSPTVKINDDIQADLNAPLDGKAVDAIREFVGRGTLVWGARTLDGNSDDWRYIQVRRTLIYIEQSVKNGLDPFVFAPNDGKTWATVVSMVSGFLNGLWSQGGLLGNTASEAYSVECGLGSTMTEQDILEGYMIVQVALQMIRPAEFIELVFKQKMAGDS